jgi:hypothetical protein
MEMLEMPWFSVAQGKLKELCGDVFAREGARCFEAVEE